MNSIISIGRWAPGLAAASIVRLPKPLCASYQVLDCRDPSPASSTWIYAGINMWLDFQGSNVQALFDAISLAIVPYTGARLSTSLMGPSVLSLHVKSCEMTASSGPNVRVCMVNGELSVPDPSARRSIDPGTLFQVAGSKLLQVLQKICATDCAALQDESQISEEGTVGSIPASREVSETCAWTLDDMELQGGPCTTP